MKKIILTVAALLAATFSVVAAAPKVAIVSILGPLKTSPSYPQWAKSVTDGLMDGSLRQQAISHPWEVSTVGSLRPQNFFYSINGVKSWDGVLNPSGEFAQESGLVLWYVIIAMGPNIALSDISIEVASVADPRLNETHGFIGRTLTDFAFVIQNGTRIISGPTTQTGEMAVAIFRPKMYQVETAADIAEIANWISRPEAPFSLSVTATVGDAVFSSFLGMSQVAAPKISVTKDRQIVVTSPVQRDLLVYRKDGHLFADTATSGTLYDIVHVVPSAPTVIPFIPDLGLGAQYFRLLVP